MCSEISSKNFLLKTKLIKSKWITVSNLPSTATEEMIKIYFERLKFINFIFKKNYFLFILIFRYGHIKSIRIDDQRFAFIRFYDRQSASKAHEEKNILDDHQLQTTFNDSSTSLSKCLRNERSLMSSPIIKPSLSSPLSITLLDKAIIPSHDERNKHTSHPSHSPEENTRLVVTF